MMLKKYFFILLFLVTFVTNFFAADATAEAELSAIRNLRAHYDPGTDTITVDWEWRESEGKQLEDYEFFVRYKVSSQATDEWRRVGADEDGLGARIPLGRILKNGDELTVQVLAEPRDPGDGDGRAPEHSDPLVIWIARKETSEDADDNDDEEESAPREAGRTAHGEEEEDNERANTDESDEAETTPQSRAQQQQREQQQREQQQQRLRQKQQRYEIPEEELIPPFNFTASVLGPAQVQLEWNSPPVPADARGLQPFYIVNVRQLSANSGDRFPPQQIRVDGNQFQLGNLVPGESFEFTLRTGLSADRISSAAAIVEISLPKEDELVEVGNLIVTSRFRPDGHGVVNLTWEVAENLRGKIRSYEMRYADAERARRLGSERWEQLIFPGHLPTAEIYNMRADTEYLLRIRTTLTSGIQVESGEFRFRTPKVGGVNPVARLDVIYSSEMPTVRLQWILAPHVQTASISGYDVYITDRYDLPESQWRHSRVDGRAPQLALDQLLPSTTYFVRVDVRNGDGTSSKSNAVYRFTTLDNLPLSPSGTRRLARGGGGESLASQQIGPGRMQISWSFMEAVRLAATGITIYYSANPNEPIERWHQIVLESADKRSVVLIGLREGLLYHVQIVPTTGFDRRPMWEHAQRLQLKAGKDESAGDEDRMGQEEDEGEGGDSDATRRHLHLRRQKRHLRGERISTVWA